MIAITLEAPPCRFHVNAIRTSEMAGASHEAREACWSLVGRGRSCGSGGGSIGGFDGGKLGGLLIVFLIG